MKVNSIKLKGFIVLFLVIVGIVAISATRAIRKVGDSNKEPVIELFKQVEAITIEGYEADAMEPFITADGRYLLFNDSNAPESSSKIHFSRRLEDTRFKYIGKLSGVTSDAKDLAPSIDMEGNFYFTSLREYSKTLKSLFHGKFDNETVLNVQTVQGDISSRTPGWLNMDCEVSKDGKLFCYSRARFEPGGHVPVESNLYLAQVVDQKVLMNPESDRMMKNINTGALEYAPAFAKNGLELYFNRANMVLVGNAIKSADVRILMASRASLKEPFGNPVKIDHINGLVEGATVSGDSSELIFHKKVGGRYKLFRASNGK